MVTHDRALMKDKVELKIISPTVSIKAQINTGENVLIDRLAYKALAKELGTYEMSWYFISPDLVKYFKDNEWKIERFRKLLIRLVGREGANCKN